MGAVQVDLGLGQRGGDDGAGEPAVAGFETDDAGDVQSLEIGEGLWHRWIVMPEEPYKLSANVTTGQVVTNS